ncbi:hypothetical protein LOTGIDRAFT_160140 [Lottia gigantea]|uniref:Uncharacterized protein n=1 Tax=Lottia gigantea TaxID=225164 RepID=V4AGW6_LOTGI|nr:hypothetical protein LOTGIDRAFT_160140 [Lottia gigantea]ESO96152.1 hypothetical protein LOTGIDRAFT_160140 [Lottia gigantea]
MANKFGLDSLPLDTKKPNTTAWINKAKPYFVDQIGDSVLSPSKYIVSVKNKKLKHIHHYPLLLLDEPELVLKGLIKHKTIYYGLEAVLFLLFVLFGGSIEGRGNIVPFVNLLSTSIFISLGLLGGKDACFDEALPGGKDACFDEGLLGSKDACFDEGLPGSKDACFDEALLGGKDACFDEGLLGGKGA